MSDAALSPLEIERAVDALSRLRAIYREPWEARQLKPMLGRSGRPLGSTLGHLTALGVVARLADGRWTLTRIGAQVLDARAGGDWGVLAALVLRAGDLEREILAFLTEATAVQGNVHMRRARARTITPTLAAVLGWHSAWRVADEFVVPLAALQTAMVGAAIDIADGRRTWVETKERIGQRAEAYSLRLERELHGPGAILHVSRDEGDHFGYDLEDISSEPSRLIECKGTASSALFFVITRNELDVALGNPDRYEIHHWANISLQRSPEDEYAALRAASYPTVIRDPAGAIERGELKAEPSAWTVTAAARLV